MGGDGSSISLAFLHLFLYGSSYRQEDEKVSLHQHAFAKQLNL